MWRNKKLLGLLLILVFALVATGCGVNNQPASGKVESGVIDQDYQGVTNPQLTKELKLSEREKQDGVDKITIKCGVKIDAPMGSGSEPADTKNQQEDGNADTGNVDKGGEDVARPKI